MPSGILAEGDLTAVLPLRVRGGRDDHELGRARLLFDTLRRFAAEGLFREILVVLPGSDVEAAASDPRWMNGLPVRLIDEDEFVPELAAHGNVGGWTKQQIVKLAAARAARTPFFLTLDADVLCTHPIDAGNLLPGGRALAQVDSRHSHPHWWRSSARILGVEPRLDAPGLNVTPVLLATEVCGSLFEALERRGRGSWVDVLLRPHRRLAWQRAMPTYKTWYRWSEYTLYFLHLESLGAFDRYHVWAESPGAPNKLVAADSVWRETRFEDWDPGKVFGPDDPALFCVVNSNAGVDPEALRERIRPFLDPT